VVKQVEKLKKNREERRAKQQEIKVEKVAQKNVDPGKTSCFLKLQDFLYLPER